MTQQLGTYGVKKSWATAHDPRPDAQKMRRHALLEIARKQPHLVEMFDGQGPGHRLEDKTKNELLQILGFADHLPRTHPIGVDPARVPYVEWGRDSLVLECRKRRLDVTAEYTVEDMAELLAEDDKRLFAPLEAKDQKKGKQ